MRSDGLEFDLPSFDLSGLTKRQREILCMRLRADLSFREIGRLLGVHHTTAWYHYQSALVVLCPTPAPK